MCQKKTAAIDPAIRTTGEESAANGADVQTELLRNPFEGPTRNPAQASDFENGYQNAQSLGHLQIAQAQPAQIQAWAKDTPAWRAGFAQAARTMGCGNVASHINPNGKVAHMNLLSLPTHVNAKIASALGTLAGSLMGAGVGAGISGLSGFTPHLAPPGEQGGSVDPTNHVTYLSRQLPQSLSDFSHNLNAPSNNWDSMNSPMSLELTKGDAVDKNLDEIGKDIAANNDIQGAEHDHNLLSLRQRLLAPDRTVNSTGRPLADDYLGRGQDTMRDLSDPSPRPTTGFNVDRAQVGGGIGAVAGGLLGAGLTQDKRKQAEYFEAAFKP